MTTSWHRPVTVPSEARRYPSGVAAYRCGARANRARFEGVATTSSARHGATIGGDLAIEHLHVLGDALEAGLRP
jgi:hypothetical protein